MQRKMLRGCRIRNQTTLNMHRRVYGRKIPRVLYHWTPLERIESILKRGLRIRQPSFDYEWLPGHLCFSDTPVRALLLCSHIPNGTTMVLFEVYPMRTYRVTRTAELARQRCFAARIKAGGSRGEGWQGSVCSAAVFAGGGITGATGLCQECGGAGSVKSSAGGVAWVAGAEVSTLAILAQVSVCVSIPAALRASALGRNGALALP